MWKRAKKTPDQLAVQAAFREYSMHRMIHNTLIGAWFVIIGMPLGTSLDQNVYPAYVHPFLRIRIISAALCLLVWLFLRTPVGKKLYRLNAMIVAMLPIGAISLMIHDSEGAVSPYYAGLSMTLVALCLLLPWTFTENLIAAALTISFYVTACLTHGPIQNGGIFYNNCYFLVFTSIIAVVGTYFTQQLRFREFIARQELDQSRKLLEESNLRLIELDKSKSRFFANISHELRTPLTLIIAPLEALNLQKAEWMDQETRSALQTMTGNAMRLLKLINDLLDLVKLESGRMELKKESLDIGSFLRGLAKSVSGVAKDKRIELAVFVPAQVGTLMMDRDKLEKVILNLVFNALKFTPAGGQVSIKADKERDLLTIKVCDNGMGISEKQLPHIFDRFWQADSASNRKYQGTGIGLSLVKELTELQGGKVSVDSQLNVGTTMTIQIPVTVSSEATIDASSEERKAGSRNDEPEEWMARLYHRAELFPGMTALADTLRSESFAKNGKPKVLVVDDEPDMLNFIKGQLSKNYEVLEAVDGNQAVEKTRQFLPEAVILDMMMPEKDGIEVCREIKANLSTKAIPVLMLTARADDDTKLAALNAGANDFLTKPFSTTELHVRLKNLVDSHHFQSELAGQNQKLESAMEQLKDTEATLVQTEKMSSLGRLSAGMIHEINNPLNYTLAAVSLLKGMREKWPEKERQKFDELLSDMNEGMTRVQTIVSDLRSFTHPHGRAADLIELNEVIAIALRFLGHEVEKNIQIEMKVPPGQKAFAEKNSLTHVFINLFQNAVDALKAKNTGGESPKLSIRSEADGKQVRVWVRDNGTGISPEYLGKVFDPFFTTKDVGEGMGLGLSICYRIMAEQGGRISVKSEVGQFTEFLLELPLKIN
jgi:signal transduction histidine kinase